jgi:hypothetical protein
LTLAGEPVVVIWKFTALAHPGPELGGQLVALGMQMEK